MQDLQDIHAYIGKHRRRRQSNKVLYGHPSPVFWLEPDVPIAEVMSERRAANRDVRKRVNLYVGTPYCLPTEPDRCGFCLFPSEIYQGRHQLVEYLRYLEREGEMFRRFFEGEELASIYFGGGTSNLYHADQYADLMGIIRSVFDIPPQIEVTLEGVPPTFTKDKLTAMKQSGINRISVGVQQLADEMIKMSGRKQKADHVFRILEWCRELELPASVDLIFGWPCQTVELMLRDLEAITATGVSHITHYELNVAGRTDFARNRRDELPSTEQNLEMYQIGKQFLERHSYRQVTPYDFEKVDGPLPSTYLYEEIFRRPFREEGNTVTSVDAWGWGFAGISFFFGTPHAPGWAYTNHVKVADYYRCLDEGRFPIQRGFRYTGEDLKLHLLFQELQAMSVDRKTYAKLFACDVVEEHRAIWQALEELGWAEITEAQVLVVGAGVFYLPLIQNLLAHDRTEEMRKQRLATVDELSSRTLSPTTRSATSQAAPPVRGAATRATP